LFDDRKAVGFRLAGSIQPLPILAAGAVSMKTGKVQSQNNWIKTGS
jgi:hypothetical protein